MNSPGEPIVFISHSRVKPGKLDALRAFLAMGSPMLEVTKPRTAAFLAYIDEAASTLTIVHVFADAASFDAHVEGADQRSGAAAELIETERMQIYGEPTAATMAAVRLALGPEVPVEVHPGFAGGFLRGGSAGSP